MQLNDICIHESIFFIHEFRATVFSCFFLCSWVFDRVLPIFFAFFDIPPHLEDSRKKSMNIGLRFLLGVMLLYCFPTSGQQSKSQTDLEYAKSLTFREITTIIGQVSEDTTMVKAYIGVYVDKAIREKEVFEEAHGYTLLSSYEKDEQSKLNLLDKAISLTLKQDSKFFPMLPYFYKGNYYLEKEQYTKSLENFIEALKHSRTKNNLSYQYAAKHNIAIIKGEIGYYQEALEIFKECLDFEKNRENFNPYAYSEILYFLSKNSIRLGLIDSAKAHITEGLSRTKSIYPMLYNKISLEEANFYLHKKDFERARNSVKRVLKNLETSSASKDDRTKILALYYLGRIEEKSGNLSQAAKEYLAMDSISNDTGLKPAEIRNGYVFLINSLTDENKKYQIVNKTLLFDSIISQNGMDVSARIFKVFDTPELLNKKEELINSLNADKKRNKKTIIAILSLLLVLGIVLYFQISNKLKLKQKFEALIVEDEINSISSSKSDEKKSNVRAEKIPETIVNHIMEGLKKFEIEKGFLNNNITSKSLAILLDTNVKYLSIVINDYKSKSFSNYLKDLRINYAIKELRVNKKLRNQYSVEGIAKEMGFNTSESFSKAFKNKTGLNPSYYIKQLTKKEE
ncbi:helix-turn-helix domain-containing protein [Maribacter sp. 2307UL18-2]|uniref:helix-turn-helix domain-containing protein n=1 Tax=Maribacter sp. 2307UL18-2 TaxID=3386274 RepID=UPI0039BC71D3